MTGGQFKQEGCRGCRGDKGRIVDKYYSYIANGDNLFRAMEKQQFSLEMGVRDYECDLQGVVNNANYQHYLEHARHEFLISRGVSFADLHTEGLDLVVTRVEIDYKLPLRSRDRFIVNLKVEREGNVRLAFFQEILKLPDNKLVVKAKVTGVAVINGRPVKPDKVATLLNI